jgi:hypothetical protein
MVLLFFLDKFLLFISFAVINSSHISIPFEVQNFKYDNIQKIINYHLYKDILVKFLVGNPPQTVHLSACLGEFATFIISKDAKGYEGGTYNKSLSNSYSSLSKNDFYTFQTFSEGIMSKDNFTIEKTKSEINELEFMLATEIGGNNCYSPYCEVLTQPGILGFLLSHQRFFDENITNINFIPQLKQKKLISNYDFYFKFNSENEGNIIIGAKPHELDNKYINQIFSPIQTSLAAHNEIDWAISFDKIYYGDESMYNEKPAMLRIEFGLIIGNYMWQQHLLDNFFTPLINENKCFKGSTLQLGSSAYFYYCNSTTDISHFKPFTFSIHEYDYNFTLTKEDLFVKDGDKLMFLMIFGGIFEIVLGFPFFKKYQLINY